MRRFLIEVSQESFERLAEIAHAERRPLKDQGAVLLERAILAQARLAQRPEEADQRQPVAA